MIGDTRKPEQDTQLFLSRLYERLRAETPEYEWDQSRAPFHSVCRTFTL